MSNQLDVPSNSEVKQHHLPLIPNARGSDNGPLLTHLMETCVGDAALSVFANKQGDPPCRQAAAWE